MNQSINEVAEIVYPGTEYVTEMVRNSDNTFKVALSVSGVAFGTIEIHAPR